MSQFPVITAGVKITADLLASMLPNYVIKASDTSRASTISVNADPELVTGTLTAGGVYLVEFHVRFACLAAAGIRTSWAVPSGTAGNRELMGPGTANATEANANTTEMKWNSSPFATAGTYTSPRNSTSTPVHFIEKAIVAIGGTSGTIALNWAQLVSNATATIVNANSFVKWQQVG